MFNIYLFKVVSVGHTQHKGVFFMKTLLLFIFFSLLCPFFLTYAMPSCEEGWRALKEPSSLIKAEIFSKSSLEKADLSWLNLQGVDLQGRDLKKALLFGADLRGANLREAILEGANLRVADLIGADLQGAKFQGAKLELARVTQEQADYLTAQGLSGFVVVGVQQANIILPVIETRVRPTYKTPIYKTEKE